MDAQRALRRLGVVVVLASALAACAGRQTEALLDSAHGLPPRAELTSVPFHPQAEKACGPAALAMALSWSGEAVAPEAVAAQVYTPGREGSLAADMLGAARRRGRLAVPVEGLEALLAELAAGHPVVVFQNLGLDIHPVWHFAVAIGYDLPAREILLHSGLDERLTLGLDTFEHTWERAGGWAMVVLPPGRLPARAGMLAVVRAGAGLERAGRNAEAAASYRAALERWPDGLPAAIGLGNALYALGDREGAAAAFRQALAIDPGSEAARRNLAYVLGE